MNGRCPCGRRSECWTCGRCAAHCPRLQERRSALWGRSSAFLLVLLSLLALATLAAAECTIVSSYDDKGRLQQCVVCYDDAGHPIYIQCY